MQDIWVERKKTNGTNESTNGSHMAVKGKKKDQILGGEVRYVTEPGFCG